MHLKAKSSSRVEILGQYLLEIPHLKETKTKFQANLGQKW